MVEGLRIPRIDSYVCIGEILKAQVKRDTIMEVKRQQQKKRGEKRLGIFQGIISNEEIERDKKNTGKEMKGGLGTIRINQNKRKKTPPGLYQRPRANAIIFRAA